MSPLGGAPADARGKGAEVSLVPVSRSNWRAVVALAPREDQAGFVAANALSLLEGLYEPGWRSMAVMADAMIVGHIRFELEARAGGAGPVGRSAWIGSLMIDARWQGRGVGRRALALALEAIRAEDPDAPVFVAVHPANPRALALYERAGFRDTGTLHDGERLLRLEPDE